MFTNIYKEKVVCTFEYKSNNIFESGSTYTVCLECS